MPDVSHKLGFQGMEVAPMAPAAFSSYFAEQVNFYAQLVRDAHIDAILVCMPERTLK